MKLGVLPLARPAFDLDHACQKLAGMHTRLETTVHEIIGPRTFLIDDDMTRHARHGLAASGADQVLILQGPFTGSGMATAAVRTIDRLLSICGTVVMLGEDGVPRACEADVHGALTQLVLQDSVQAPVLLTDLADIDVNDDTGVFWHCGRAPFFRARSRNPHRSDESLQPNATPSLRVRAQSGSGHLDAHQPGIQRIADCAGNW